MRISDWVQTCALPISQITVAPADIGLVRARFALLIRSGDHDADRVVGKAVDDDPRYFGVERIAAVARRIIDALDRQAAAQPRLVERARGADVDRRTAAARLHRSPAAIVHLDRGSAFGDRTRVG